MPSAPTSNRRIREPLKPAAEAPLRAPARRGAPPPALSTQRDPRPPEPLRKDGGDLASRFGRGPAALPLPQPEQRGPRPARRARPPPAARRGGRPRGPAAPAPADGGDLGNLPGQHGPRPEPADLSQRNVAPVGAVAPADLRLAGGAWVRRRLRRDPRTGAPRAGALARAGHRGAASHQAAPREATRGARPGRCRSARQLSGSVPARARADRLGRTGPAGVFSAARPDRRRHPVGARAGADRAAAAAVPTAVHPSGAQAVAPAPPRDEVAAAWAAPQAGVPAGVRAPPRAEAVAADPAAARRVRGEAARTSFFPSGPSSE